MARTDTRTQAGRALSQHSLRDQNVARRIVAHSGLAPPAVVYEVGAGGGVLTAELARVAGRVVAVEQQRSAWSALKCRFAGDPRVAVELGDFLRYPLPARGDYFVAGNPPFAITSALLRRLMSLPNPPVETLLVVQREAALRWSGECEESVASLVAKVRFEFEIRLALRRQDFRPYPRVGCVVLSMRRRERPLLARGAERHFELFLRRQFGRAGRGSGRLRGGAPGERTLEEWLERFRGADAGRKGERVAARGLWR